MYYFIHDSFTVYFTVYFIQYQKVSVYFYFPD